MGFCCCCCYFIYCTFQTWLIPCVCRTKLLSIAAEKAGCSKKKIPHILFRGNFDTKLTFLSLSLSLSNDDKVKFGALIQEQIVTESSIFIDAECEGNLVAKAHPSPAYFGNKSLSHGEILVTQTIFW